jgi:iron complex outermembrane receptor protein
MLPFVRALNADLGYRETEFKSGNKDSLEDYSSWKIGRRVGAGQDMFRFRGMVQKATRAPNVNELFAPKVTGLSNLAVDPCQLANINKADAGNKAGTLSNLCRLTGVPLSDIGKLPAPSSGQINNLAGGNPDLGPEVGQDQDLGFVWEPVPKLAISLDYYKIDDHQDAVSRPSTTDILDRLLQRGPESFLTINVSSAAWSVVTRSTVPSTVTWRRVVLLRSVEPGSRKAPAAST